MREVVKFTNNVRKKAVILHRKNKVNRALAAKK